MALNVLIVDDSPVMRNLVARVVNLSGIDVSARFDAENGAKALDVMASEHIDLVLADINMPVMNGEEMVRQMNQDERLRKLPVIVISTDGTLKREKRMKDLGVIGYLHKPFRPEELRDEVERVMDIPRFSTDQIDMAIKTAATKVLETMCFTIVSDIAPGPLEKQTTPLGVAVEFSGSLSGRLKLFASQEFTESLPSSFPGEVGDSQTSFDGLILSEIANMICGAALTELWSEGEFQLAPPNTITNDEADSPEGHLVQSDDGCIWFGFELTQAWKENCQFAY